MAGNDLLWMKDFIQDDLYLVDTDKAIVAPIPDVKQETAKITFNCLGRIDSGFLILVNYTDEEHIDPLHQQSLTSILGRKSINAEDVTIINLFHQTDKAYDVIMKYFNPQHILIMGTDALPTGLAALKLNTIVHGEPKILYALSFSEMDNNEKKRAFWEEMKNF